MQKQLQSCATASVLALLSTSAQAATEVTWWHSMAGALGERIAGLADQFNKSQSKYKVNPVFKGSYDEAMAAAITAYRQAMHRISCRCPRSARQA